MRTNTTGPKQTKAARQVISFELPDEVLELLVQDAKAHSVKSRHIRARDLVTERLSQSEDIADLLGELDAKIAGLKTMIQRSTYAFLVYGVGKPPAEANAWIREHLTLGV